MIDPIDRALGGVAADVVFPPTPSLLPRISRRLGASAELGSGRRRWARAFVLAVGLSLLVVAAVAALAWVLPGLRIIPVASVPAAPTDLGAGLTLGEPIQAADAPFTVEALGPPEAAYESADGSVVSLVYAAGDGLAEMDGAGIGLLVQRIEGELDATMVEKLVEEVGARVTPVTVGSADGFWIEGPPHLVRYLAPGGGVRAEMTRLAGDTLVWQRDGILYRMESALGLAESRRLGASVTEH
jgi:hypothetical protein